MGSPVHSYDELRLRIDHLDAGRYRVLATTHSGAEAKVSFELPFSPEEIENFIVDVSQPRGRWRSGTSAIADARRFGGELFTALFQDEVRGVYREALAQARARERGVRITLCLSDSPELIDVPWEYLCDGPNFLALSELTPVVRYLDLPRAPRPLLVEPPLRVLGIVSGPSDCDRLDVQRERQNLERALSSLTETGAVELHWLDPATPGSLLRALRTQTFHALHYIGHGRYDSDHDRGVLLFEDDEGWSRAVGGDELGDVLHDSSMRLVVLNACEGARTARSDPFTGVAGSLVQRDIPAVVAMQFEISDEAAIVFAHGFYGPIAAGSPVDASVAAARLAMRAERGDDIEWGTPVLFMRVPDGRIFNLDDPVRGLAPTNGAAATTSPADVGPQSPPSIVVSYRRDDTAGYGRLLAERLGQRFGAAKVQLCGDDDRLGPVEPAIALVTLIGSTWVASLKGTRGGPPVEDPGRRELERALRDYPDRVVPVLIDTQMPDAETLPRSLRGVRRQEAARIRRESFERDVEALIARLERIAAMPATPPAVERPVAPATRSAGSSEVAAGVPAPYHDHYNDVIAAMLDGTVVPLLGSGTTSAGGEIAELLAERFAVEPTGLASIAQRVAVTHGERRLYAEFKDLLAARSQPNEVHRFLAAFPSRVRQRGLDPCHQLIIDANYGSELECAFEDAGEPFDYAVYLARSGWFIHVPWGEQAAEPTATTIREPRRYVDFPIDDEGQLERTIIVKIQGARDGSEGETRWQNNYVVTEDQYIDYLPTHNIQDHLPIQLLDKLTGSRCLFLGYRFRDWNARVFPRRTWRGNPFTENSWAIEHEPDVLEKALWNAIGHVELLASALPDYVGALDALLLDRHPGQG
jgi:hypothetical protein